MELKPYQQLVLDDLDRFLHLVQQHHDPAKAFHSFWTEHPRNPVQPFSGMAIEPYKNILPRVPHICLKVPTAGGKTFIAANALDVIFRNFGDQQHRAVVWLVPGITILEQTLKSFRNPAHPYRVKLNTHFNSRVEVYDKATLLQGGGFNSSSVKEQLSIFVLSFDSLRARNKEDRKVHQENSQLASFASMLDPEAELSLMSVIQKLNPVVVVDESHNAESELSVDMLKTLNPSFVLDLTATPRKHSNILSFVDAMELKKEHMVKLPVIVYNHADKTDVIAYAIQLQRKLEAEADAERKQGGRYIRPIVLFQAQPKTGDDNTTFEKLKQKLVEMRIPAEQIKIKTADINEIKDMDLMSEDCPVRFIITVNALKEGWDCPFAYILASLADKSSAVDVEQILGRVLRQPYVTRHSSSFLNLSYVMTASARFMDTLQNIVNALNKAGFSDKDYRRIEPVSEPETKVPSADPLATLFDQPKAQQSPVTATTEVDEIDVLRVIERTEVVAQEPASALAQIEAQALQEEAAFDAKIRESSVRGEVEIPALLQSMVKTYPIKTVFQEEAEALKLPQFFFPAIEAGLFGTAEDDSGAIPVDKTGLLVNFPLSREDKNIAFDQISSEIYKVDLDPEKASHTPSFIKLDSITRSRLLDYLFDSTQPEQRLKRLTAQVVKDIGNMYPIADREIQLYVRQLLEGFSAQQFKAFENNYHAYVARIKSKIDALATEYAKKSFQRVLDTDQIYLKPGFLLRPKIAPATVGKDLPKSLYEKEGKMNGFEERVINEVANLANIFFWHRNLEHTGFYINGFVKHYPDFIIRTKKGKTILLETKGDHLDAADKILLGSLWASKAGSEYRYYMVYENRAVDGAHTLEQFLDKIREL
jgi:type III restriction enzyme